MNQLGMRVCMHLQLLVYVCAWARVSVYMYDFQLARYGLRFETMWQLALPLQKWPSL